MVCTIQIQCKAHSHTLSMITSTNVCTMVTNYIHTYVLHFIDITSAILLLNAERLGRSFHSILSTCTSPVKEIIIKICNATSTCTLIVSLLVP